MEVGEMWDNHHQVHLWQHAPRLRQGDSRPQVALEILCHSKGRVSKDRPGGVIPARHRSFARPEENRVCVGNHLSQIGWHLERCRMAAKSNAEEHEQEKACQPWSAHRGLLILLHHGAYTATLIASLEQHNGE